MDVPSVVEVQGRVDGCHAQALAERPSTDVKDLCQTCGRRWKTRSLVRPDPAAAGRKRGGSSGTVFHLLLLQRALCVQAGQKASAAVRDVPQKPSGNTCLAQLWWNLLLYQTESSNSQHPHMVGGEMETHTSTPIFLWHVQNNQIMTKTHPIFFQLVNKPTDIERQNVK